MNHSPWSRIDHHWMINFLRSQDSWLKSFFSFNSLFTIEFLRNMNNSNFEKSNLILQRKKVSADFVPSSLEESIQLLDSLEKPPKSEKSNSQEKLSPKTSKITNHILNSAVDLNILHEDITNEQEAGCSYSTEPSTIDLIWKSTVESTRKRINSQSSKKLWSFMNLQKPAVYRINRKYEFVLWPHFSKNSFVFTLYFYRNATKKIFLLLLVLYPGISGLVIEILSILIF